MKQYEKAVTPIAEIMRMAKKRKELKEKTKGLAFKIITYICAAVFVLSFIFSGTGSTTAFVTLMISWAWLMFWAVKTGQFRSAEDGEENELH